MNESSNEVTHGQVRAAAVLVELELSEDDIRDVAALLSQWIPAATRLSTRMQAPTLDRLTPITAFVTANGNERDGSAP